MFGAEVVRQLRQRAGVSQREFASLAVTSQSTLSGYERGEKSPTLDTLARLASSVGLVPVVSFVPSLETALRSLTERFSEVAGAEEIWIFGSYVPFVEQRGSSAPADLDILVVGEPNKAEAGKAARLAQQDLGIYVDLAVLPTSEWAGESGFVRGVRASPLVRVL